MKRLVYLVVGLLLLLPAPAIAADWTTRGGDGYRTHQSALELGAIDVTTPLWSGAIKVGATGAQPVMIGDKIYQLGGQTLWEIDSSTGSTRPLAGGFGKLSNGTWRPSTSSLAYSVVNGNPILYFGTGDNSLCAINLATQSKHCHRLHPNATPTNHVPTPVDELPIVATPLVMITNIDGRETDFVTMGDKQGRLWVFQGFGSFDQPYTWNYQQYDGWLVASMVEVSERPLTFIWGSTSKSIYAHQITPGRAGMKPTLTEAWATPVRTHGQVADGFAKVGTPSGERVYALDSIGNLFQIRATTGESSTVHLNDVSFTNMSPAVDETTIYLAIRETTPETGALVAVDRATFQEKWRAPLPARANTNPLLLSKANAVLVGDTMGVLHAFDSRTGARTTIFKGQTPLHQLAGLPAPLDPLGQSYQTLTGLSETILAGDPPMLITGISGAAQGKPDGYLFAYGTLPSLELPADDLAVRLQVKEYFDCPERKEGSVSFLNAGTTAVKANVLVQFGGKSLLAGMLNLQPGWSSRSLALFGVECGDSASLTATVAHIEPGVPELDLGNNQAGMRVSIGEAPQSNGGGSGEKRVIMVPADCQVNPDWTSNQPCLNYPGLVVP